MQKCLLLFFLFVSWSLFANWSVSGGLTHYDEVKTGQKLLKTIIIENHSDTEKTFELSKGDYAFNAKGNIWFVSPGKLIRSNADWIQIPSQKFTVKAKSQKSFDYYVNIPDDSSLNGAYWSVIFISETQTQHSESDHERMDLNVKQRYAIQSIQQIEDTGTYKIEFLNATYSQKEQTLNLKVKNTGERFIQPEVWVELFTEDGQKIGRFYANQSKLYPQTSYNYQIPIIPLSQKKYVAITVVDCGQYKLFGSQYTIQN